MNKLKKLNIQAIKKILQRRGYKVSKKHESFFSIYYTAFASIFLILIFYAIPFVMNISSKVFKKNEIVINTSNKNFNRVMEGKEIELLVAVRDKYCKYGSDQKCVECNSHQKYGFNQLSDLRSQLQAPQAQLDM